MTEENDQKPVEDSIDEFVDPISAEAKRLANRPMIDHLPDAVERDELGRFVLSARPGDKIIMERWATILKGRPWLDTKTYTIVSIDEASGEVHLWDDDLQRNATTNYITGTKAGYRFKLPTKKGMLIGTKRRGRPRKNPTDAPTNASPGGPPVVKKRGRPAGTKNRDRDVIAAEKRAKAQLKSDKKAKKK